MKLSTKRLQDFLANTWLAFLGSVASIVSLVWGLYATISDSHFSPIKILLILTIPVLLLVVIAIGIYSVKVRQENRKFTGFIRILHRVNHDYRDTLSAVFKDNSREFNSDSYAEFLRENEHRTLKSVCQKISKVFSSFTSRDCSVTVMLINREGEKSFCEKSERSEENCERDKAAIKRFPLNTGENTAFDQSLIYATGKISRFYSANLISESDYRCSTDNWRDFYRSQIVVPIRCVNPEKIGSKDCSDDIGFLSVDTFSVNRLNDTWHTELLAAFADQMYNFMSLMRGRYTLKFHSIPPPKVNQAPDPKPLTLS